MIRMILFVVVGLLAGLGAGTGFAVLKAKSAFAAESSRRAKVVADSLAEHAAGDAKKVADKEQVLATPTDSATSATHDEAAAPLSTEPVASKPKDEPVASKPRADPVASKAKEEPRETPHNVAPTTTVAQGAGMAKPTATAPAGAAEQTPAVSGPAPLRPPVTSAASKSEDIAQPKRISKIFAAMPPKDAAKVLMQMDDTDVHLILDALGDKQAAAILQNFPADRAAAISKRAMRSSRQP
jgi:hypothetical protein